MMEQGDISMPEIAWINGTIYNLFEARVSFLDRGNLFGDGVYEVVRVYNQKPFALDKHLERLERSLSGIRLQHPLSRIKLQSLILSLVEQAGFADAIVYLQITRGGGMRQHAFPVNSQATLAVFVAPAASPAKAQSEGVKIITLPDDRWAHCYIKSINLLPNVLAKQTAKEKGAYEAVFIRDNTLVSEGSSSNVFAVIRGEIITPPADGHILAGVTRGLCLEIARKAGYSAREEVVTIEELRQAEEIILTSTTMEIIPVVELDGNPVGRGQPGSVAVRLLEEYKRCAGDAWL